MQEALTNVLKHARGARASVVLRYTDTAVELSVRDDGRGGPAGTGLGHGLIGMRERVALYGGTLSTGPGPAGGYRVAAALPLEDAPVGHEA